MKQEKARLMIDFDNKDSLIAFVIMLKEKDFISQKSTVYHSNMDDFTKDGITKGNSFIVMDEGSRSEDQRLKIIEVHERTV